MCNDWVQHLEYDTFLSNMFVKEVLNSHKVQFHCVAQIKINK